MSYSKRLFLLFATTTAVLLVSFAVLFFAGVVTLFENATLQAHEALAEQLNQTFSTLKDAEAGQRGYLLNPDPQYLNRFQTAVSQLQSDLKTMGTRNRRGNLNLEDVAALKKLVDEKLADLRAMIDLRDKSGIDAVSTALKSSGDREKMTAVHQQIEWMVNGEQAKLLAARNVAAKSVTFRGRLFLVILIVNLVYLYWAYRRLKREVAAREATALEVQRQKDLLSETLGTLRVAKQEVETASRAKDQFLASLSHELRTPLTPVLAMLTAWDAGRQVPEPLMSDVQMMRRNVELEARLIDDLLDLTRISRGKLALNLEVVDIHALAIAAGETCDGEMRAKKIQLSYSLCATRHHASVDPARLQQVLWNILKNAAKFTPEGGSINIESADISDGRLEISINDTGIGMGPEILARIFRPFDQGADDITRRFGGLGLGMAISKALLDAQQGTIEAHSPGDGQGSTFKITLATVLAPVALPAVSMSPAASQPANLEKRRLKILLVEDHEDTADVLGRVLRGSGHDVEIRDSVASATQSVDSSEFDLLLSDIGLPDGTGIDLIRHVRQRCKMPAIALTGYGMEEDVARCRDAGFDAHLTKPISFQKLEALIGQIA